jgi:hypothetical protein
VGRKETEIDISLPGLHRSPLFSTGVLRVSRGICASRWVPGSLAALAVLGAACGDDRPNPVAPAANAVTSTTEPTRTTVPAPTTTATPKPTPTPELGPPAAPPPRGHTDSAITDLSAHGDIEYTFTDFNTYGHTDSAITDCNTHCDIEYAISDFNTPSNIDNAAPNSYAHGGIEHAISNFNTRCNNKWAATNPDAHGDIEYAITGFNTHGDNESTASGFNAHLRACRTSFGSDRGCASCLDRYSDPRSPSAYGTDPRVSGAGVPGAFSGC